MAPLTPALNLILLNEINVYSIDVPTSRVGPDRVISLLYPSGEARKIQVIANGNYLRDPSSRQVWPTAVGALLLTEVEPPPSPSRYGGPDSPR